MDNSVIGLHYSNITMGGGPDAAQCSDIRAIRRKGEWKARFLDSLRDYRLSQPPAPLRNSAPSPPEFLADPVHCQRFGGSDVPRPLAPDQAAIGHHSSPRHRSRI